MARFNNRQDAGRELAAHLKEKGLTEATVMTLPGTSAAVALPIAHMLRGDLIVGFAEPAEDAGGVSRGPAARERMRDRARAGQTSLLGAGGADASMASRVSQSFEGALEHLEHHEELPEVKGKTVVLVTDGLADEREVHATVVAINEHGPARLVVAMPMITWVNEDELSSEVAELVFLERGPGTGTADEWYEAGAPSDSDLAQMLQNYEGLQAYRRTFTS